ncbi:MAG: hypothetical protein U9R50_08545 [Campylobacterota bacterium]|nr:hypothetical protein [Campylobacterota bacterium]
MTTLHDDYKLLENKLLHVKQLFMQSNESIHKARNELRIIELDEQKMVVKSFKIPHLLNRFVYSFFRKSKAYKSYHNALKLLELNVNTPKPVALIQNYDFFLLRESYFISLYEPYDFTIREAFHHKIEDYKEVIKAFVAFTYNLHVKGIWHEDYSLGNILITRQKEGYRFALVDINRMKFMSISAEKGCENFSKLWAQEEDLVLMAQEYAQLSGLSAEKSLNLIHYHVQRVKDKKALKQKFEKLR